MESGDFPSVPPLVGCSESNGFVPGEVQINP
jgi:hypothetical protein